MTNKKTYGFTDNFVFCRVLQRNPHIAKRLIEMILEFEIESLSLVQGEFGIDLSKEIRSVRYDVMAKNSSEIYDVEMQTYEEKSLDRRIRYYTALMTLEDMKKGDSFDRMKNCYMIMICTYDPFKMNHPIYRFRRKEERDRAPDFDDGSRCIVINAACKDLDVVTADVANLIRYIASGSPVDKFTDELDNRVEEILKDPREVRARMFFGELMDRAKEEGIKEARKLYIIDTVNHVMSKGSFSSEEEACDFLGFDVKEYQEAKEQFKEENGSSDQN